MCRSSTAAAALTALVATVAVACYERRVVRDRVAPPAPEARVVAVPKYPVTFMKVGGRAERVVYLCDRSGAFIRQWDDVRVALRKSIDGLAAEQRFNVVFFGQRDCIALAPQLLPATPDSRRQAHDFIDRSTCAWVTDNVDEAGMVRGHYLPLDSRPAIRAAFGAKPDLIYLMTSEEFADDTSMRDEIRRLNVDHSVVVHAIACGGDGQAYETILKDIAAENGGTLSFVKLWGLDP